MADLSNLRNEIGNGLFPYVKLIHEAPGIDGFNFNPVALICAVNGLWPAGPDRALAAARAYNALSTADPNRGQQYGLDEQRIFLVLRLLFVRKDGDPVMPPLQIGAPDVPVPQDRAAWPLFPLAVAAQIPFLVAGGYMLGGMAQNPADHIDYCAQNCRLRDAPLAPEASPVGAVESLLATWPWANLAPDADARQRLTGMLHQQAIRALAPLYTLPDQEMAALYPGMGQDFMAVWARQVAKVRPLSPRWNSQTQQFEAGS